jgi:hypothetical protein
MFKEETPAVSPGEAYSTEVAKYDDWWTQQLPDELKPAAPEGL